MCVVLAQSAFAGTTWAVSGGANKKPALSSLSFGSDVCLCGCGGWRACMASNVTHFVVQHALIFIWYRWCAHSMPPFANFEAYYFVDLSDVTLKTLHTCNFACFACMPTEKEKHFVPRMGRRGCSECARLCIIFVNSPLVRQDGVSAYYA